MGKCKKLILDTDFFRGITSSKKSTKTEVISQLFLEKISPLIANGYELIFTDGSVSDNGTSFAF